MRRHEATNLNFFNLLGLHHTQWVIIRLDKITYKLCPSQSIKNKFLKRKPRLLEPTRHLQSTLQHHPCLPTEICAGSVKQNITPHY